MRSTIISGARVFCNIAFTLLYIFISLQLIDYLALDDSYFNFIRNSKLGNSAQFTIAAALLLVWILAFGIFAAIILVFVLIAFKLLDALIYRGEPKLTTALWTFLGFLVKTDASSHG